MALTLGCSLLTARGVPCSGEGDLKNCVAMKVLDLLGAGGSFTDRSQTKCNVLSFYFLCAGGFPGSRETDHHVQSRLRMIVPFIGRLSFRHSAFSLAAAQSVRVHGDETGVAEATRATKPKRR